MLLTLILHLLLSFLFPLTLDEVSYWSQVVTGGFLQQEYA